jgi:hypothetical protein
MSQFLKENLDIETTEEFGDRHRETINKNCGRCRLG